MKWTRFCSYRPCVRLAAVLVALPPDEAGNAIAAALPVRELLVEVAQHLVGRAEAVVVLLAGVPVDGLRLGALFPPRRRILVPGVNIAILLEPLTVRGKIIPARLVGQVAAR